MVISCFYREDYRFAQLYRLQRSDVIPAHLVFSEFQFFCCFHTMIICRLFVCSRAGIAPDNPLRIRGKTLILSCQPKIKYYRVLSVAAFRVSEIRLPTFLCVLHHKENKKIILLQIIFNFPCVLHRKENKKIILLQIIFNFPCVLHRKENIRL